MSLSGSLQMASNALQADQIALQVTGQNIANANTPSYVREEVNLTPGPTQQIGSILLGTGVEVNGVTQLIDNYLTQRLRNAGSDESSTAAQQNAYTQLEEIVGALNNNSLGTSMTNFFNSISNVLSDPSDLSTRNMVVLNGEQLTQQIQQMAQQATVVRNDLDSQISAMGDQINSLIEQVRSLNVQIAQIKGGNASSSDAVGLNDQRLAALSSLSQLIDIQVVNNPSGTVNVYCGSDNLVTDGFSNPVDVVQTSVDGRQTSQIQVQSTKSPLDATSGQLYGLTNARDDILGNYLDQLDSFSSTLAFEFNKVYSAGQGLDGFTSLTSEFAVQSPNEALNQAGLPFTPNDGSFQVTVYENQNGTEVPVQTGSVAVQLDGTPQDTTLNSLAASLNSINGLSATVTSNGKLDLQSTSANEQFAFSGDTSGVLAALGLNTFFTGSSAEDLGVSANLQANPGLFAASQGGLAADTNNASVMAGFMDQPLTSQNGASISNLYDNLVANVSQGSALATSAATSAQTFQQTLQGQETSISGVNIDEEVMNMLQYQESYEASAKYISALQTLLQTLVQL